MKITGINNLTIHILNILETNYCYLISCENEAVVIDPGEAAPVLKVLKNENLTLKSILLTHRDFDHVGGVTTLEEIYKDLRIIDYKSTAKSILSENVPIKIIKTPGHTLDSCSFLLPDLNAVFTGDTLFTGICGKVRNSMYKEMFSSLQILKKLPGNTSIFPGHEYLKFAVAFMKEQKISSNFYNTILNNAYPSLATTIRDEIDNNIFLTSDFSKFKKLRELKG